MKYKLTPQMSGVNVEIEISRFLHLMHSCNKLVAQVHLTYTYIHSTYRQKDDSQVD